MEERREYMGMCLMSPYDTEFLYAPMLKDIGLDVEKLFKKFGWNDKTNGYVMVYIIDEGEYYFSPYPLLDVSRLVPLSEVKIEEDKNE